MCSIRLKRMKKQPAKSIIFAVQKDEVLWCFDATQPQTDFLITIKSNVSTTSFVAFARASQVDTFLCDVSAVGAGVFHRFVVWINFFVAAHAR